MVMCDLTDSYRDQAHSYRDHLNPVGVSLLAKEPSEPTQKPTHHRFIELNQKTVSERFVPLDIENF